MPNLTVTILGCGGSAGVPLIGGNWGAADPLNPKNNRTRPSIYVASDSEGLLIDTSPDCRTQLLRENVKSVTAVVYTHAHADHMNGIDDIRSINWMMGRKIDVYGDENTFDIIRTRFSYIVEGQGSHHYYVPHVELHKITSDINGSFSIGDIRLRAFEQDHGYSTSLGYVFNDRCAYTTDAKALSDDVLSALADLRLDLWVVDACRDKVHSTHSHLEQTLSWIERVRPRHAVLTHMSHDVDYETWRQKLPAGVEPAFDGMKLIVPY
jgi:phosphoribosyl 1,2-cyclic phosphate phosphodiesterase